jgi:hypothetical protein
MNQLERDKKVYERNFHHEPHRQLLLVSTVLLGSVLIECSGIVALASLFLFSVGFNVAAF